MKYIVLLLIIIASLIFLVLVATLVYLKWAHLCLELLIPRFIASLKLKANKEILGSRRYRRMIRSLKVFSYFINHQIITTQKDYVAINDFMVYKLCTGKTGEVTAQIHIRSYPVESIKTKFCKRKCAEDLPAAINHILENKIAPKVELISHNHLLNAYTYRKYICECLKDKNYKMNYNTNYSIRYMVWIYCELFLVNRGIDFFTIEGMKIFSRLTNVVYVSIEL